MSFSQTKFSFADAQKKSHTLVLVQGEGGQQGAAILDGKWVVLKVLPGEGRFEYKNGDLQFDLKGDAWGSTWDLACDGRGVRGLPSQVKLTESVLSHLELGPLNELVPPRSGETVLRRHGWKSHERGPAEEGGASERSLHETVEGFQSRVLAAPAIMAVNILLWVVMVSQGAYQEDSSTRRILDWGAQYGPYIARGQGWRLLSAMFLHGNWFHLLSNMLALWSVGPFIERVVGSAGFLAIYLVSGLWGSLASLYVNPGVISVGASGAIFGLFGALVGLMFRYHVYVRRKDVIKYVALVVLLVVQSILEGSQVGSSMHVRVDYAAHGGGLIAGFVSGLLMSRPVAPERRWIRSAVLAGAGTIGAVGLALLHPPVVDVLDEIQTLVAAEQRLEATIQSALIRAERREISQVDVADVIDREVIPRWVAASTRFQGAIDRAPSCHRPMLRPLGDFVDLRLRSLGLFSEAVRKNDYSILQVAMKKVEEGIALLKRLEQDPGRN
ncbi:MAG TPA: rhomboid family intramembrane serine protease [Planctomycetota bacterium]|nr:rhomboid family intramembrane serine protease [Planctomycetota bacterium]